MAKQESDEHLWVVVFEYYPNFEFASEAREIFDQKITNWLWVICQDGSIVSEKSKRRKMTLIIDLEDENTLKSMNLLPRLFNQGFSTMSRSWGVRVFDKDDPGWEDVVKVDSEGVFFLEGLNNAWDHLNENLDELTREIEIISVSLDEEV